MKQHIIQKQWDELSDKEKLKFINSSEYRQGALPNIGQMIEFLGDDWIRKIGCIVCTGDDVYPNYQITNDKLCDELWNAVKSKQ